MTQKCRFLLHLLVLASNMPNKKGKKVIVTCTPKISKFFDKISLSQPKKRQKTHSLSESDSEFATVRSCISESDLRSKISTFRPIFQKTNLAVLFIDIGMV